MKYEPFSVSSLPTWRVDCRQVDVALNINAPLQVSTSVTHQTLKCCLFSSFTCGLVPCQHRPPHSGFGSRLSSIYKQACSKARSISRRPAILSSPRAPQEELPRTIPPVPARAMSQRQALSSNVSDSLRHRSFWVLALWTSLFAFLFMSTCYLINGPAALTRKGHRGSLWAIGGVFGEQRPVLEVIKTTVSSGLIGMCALGVIDLAYARYTQARWFALHIAANAWIAMLCLPDLWIVLSSPIEALQDKSVGHWPIALVFSIHVYHMLFFRRLHWIDWLHHILMAVVGAPCLITSEVGPLMNFNNFFMCGIPGGLDYVMLFAVKHGWLNPLLEKKANAAINVWCRAPFLVCTASLAYVQFFVQEGVPLWLKYVRGFLVMLACWNGLFFMERVVGNFHVGAYKHLQKGLPGLTKESQDYSSDDHFGGSVPGLGMRVSVSKQDLQQLENDSHYKKY